jgi:GTPase SAR1 family protein
MSSDASPPVVTLLKDVPSDLAQDEFAHSTYVTVLAESLRRAERPLTVGLFGPWGVGKSSILERLRGSLSSEECAFVLFDAWRYDGETLRRHLLRETAGQLAAAGAIGPGFDPEKRLEELVVDRQATRLRIDRSWVNMIPGLAAAVVAFLVLVGARGPAVDDVLAVALRPATAPAATTEAFEGIRFPRYEHWRSTGARTDVIDGRRVRTVFYERDGRTIAYAVVAGAALSKDGALRAIRGADDVVAVTWTRRGRTCVIAAAGVDADVLASLAVW